MQKNHLKSQEKIKNQKDLVHHFFKCFTPRILRLVFYMFIFEDHFYKNQKEQELLKHDPIKWEKIPSITTAKNGV